MKTKIVTDHAESEVLHIAFRIAADNPSAASRYTEQVEDSFLDLADNVLPRRADESLPEYVREIGVQGFRGYTLRIAVFETEVYLLNAFAPGLADGQKNAATGQALGEV